MSLLCGNKRYFVVRWRSADLITRRVYRLANFLLVWIFLSMLVTPCVLAILPIRQLAKLIDYRVVVRLAQRRFDTYRKV